MLSGLIKVLHNIYTFLTNVLVVLQLLLQEYNINYKQRLCNTHMKAFKIRSIKNIPKPQSVHEAIFSQTSSSVISLEADKAWCLGLQSYVGL